MQFEERAQLALGLIELDIAGFEARSRAGELDASSLNYTPARRYRSGLRRKSTTSPISALAPS